MASLLRRSLAEALGTFALVFIGAGSAASKFFPDSNYGLLGIAIAHGLVLAVMLTATLTISGGYLNPAVTLGLLAARRTDLRTAVTYIVAQLAGAMLAAAALKALYPTGVMRTISLGTPRLATSLTVGPAIGIEALLTFFLVSAVFGTCINPDAPKLGGLSVGLALIFGMLFGGPLTGAAMNPARAFGPALVAGEWVAQGVYWIGPILGGVLAALLWEHVLLPKRQP